MNFKFAFFQDLENPTTKGYAIDEREEKVLKDDKRYIEFVKVRDEISIDGKPVPSENKNIKLFFYKNYIMIQVPYKERDAFNRVSVGLFVFEFPNNLRDGNLSELISRIKKISEHNGRTVSPDFTEEEINKLLKKVIEDRKSSYTLDILATILAGCSIGWVVDRERGLLIGGVSGFLTGLLVTQIKKNKGR